MARKTSSREAEKIAREPEQPKPILFEGYGDDDIYKKPKKDEYLSLKAKQAIKEFTEAMKNEEYTKIKHKKIEKKAEQAENPKPKVEEYGEDYIYKQPGKDDYFNLTAEEMIKKSRQKKQNLDKKT